jgi:hypothetical protein
MNLKKLFINNETIIYSYKALLALSRALIKWIYFFLPASILSFIAGKGYPRFILREVEYYGRVNFTEYKIMANTKYQIEVAGTTLRGGGTIRT